MRYWVLQRWETEALGDSNMRSLQKGDVIQLERKGYYIVDRPYLRPGKSMLLLNIPDGRQTPLRKPVTAAQTPSQAVNKEPSPNGVAKPSTPAQSKGIAATKKKSKAAGTATATAAGGKKGSKAVPQEELRGLSDTPASTKVDDYWQPYFERQKPIKYTFCCIVHT